MLVENKHPNYYLAATRDSRQIEVFEVIDAFVGGDFYLGNVLKYVCRAGRKPQNAKEADLRKAIHYLEEAIKRLEN